MCVSLSWGMGSGPVRRRATVEPTVPKPRMPTRQRLSRSVGLLPEVWNEFRGTLDRLYQTGKNRRKNFYRYIYIRRYLGALGALRALGAVRALRAQKASGARAPWAPWASWAPRAAD